MNNNEKYAELFMDVFMVGRDDVSLLTYQSIQNWDSVGHMRLIASLEEAFDIMMDTDDIIDLSSFEKGKEILAKYDVEFD